MAEKDSYFYIDKFLELTGINMDMKTDPKIIAKVMQEDMLLLGFESAKTLLCESLEKPVSLRPMFEKIRRAIITKQPAIYDFLTEAIDSKLISDVKDENSKDIIIRAIHHSYILNELTIEIVNNIDFVFKIQEYLLKQREKYGIRTNFIDALEDLKKLYRGSMFEPTKIVGMDMVYRSRAIVRKNGVITDAEIKSQQDGLKLNILEAAVTDTKAGYADNAIVGAVLSAISPDTVSLSPDGNKVMLFHLSRKWTSLYETWNLAFCTGNLAYLQMLYPKLLIPAVIDADNNEYLINRSAALWLSTIFHQFAALNKKADAPVPNKKELARVWGKVNLKYAQELAKEETGKDLSDFSEILNISLSEIIDTMKHTITSVPLTKEESDRLSKIYN